MSLVNFQISDFYSSLNDIKTCSTARHCGPTASSSQLSQKQTINQISINFPINKQSIKCQSVFLLKQIINQISINLPSNRQSNNFPRNRQPIKYQTTFLETNNQYNINQLSQKQTINKISINFPLEQTISQISINFPRNRQSIKYQSTSLETDNQSNINQLS